MLARIRVLVSLAGAAAGPYLERLSYLIFGSGKQGDFSTSKVIVGIRP